MHQSFDINDKGIKKKDFSFKKAVLVSIPISLVLTFFFFHDFIPFTVELLLVIFSLILLKNYRPYDFPHWTKEK